MSVSRETSSKSHTSRNEHFVQDFLQHSCIKSAKRALGTRPPPSHTSKSPKRALHAKFPSKGRWEFSETTHSAALPTVSQPQPLQTTADPNVTATFTSTNCHENSLRHLQHAQSTAPAMKSDDVTASYLQPKLHHTTRFGMISTAHSEHTHIHQNHHFVSKTPLPSNSLKRKSQCHSHIQHSPQKTPPSKRQSQPDCEGNSGSHKTMRLGSEIILHTSTCHVFTRFLANSHESDTSC